jgi:hypothetical protein
MLAKLLKSPILLTFCRDVQPVKNADVKTYIGKFSKLPAFFPKLVAKVYTNIIFMI